MKLEQLKDLVAIVEHGSLRAASRQRESAEPTLSKSIRALERELGVVLFERDPKGMALTPLGRLFHERASGIVNELRRARDELAQSNGDDTGQLVAGLSIMPHMGMLPHALPAFWQRYPKVRLELIEGLFPELETRLRNGSIDVYLGAAPRLPIAPGLRSTLLFENTRAAVVRRGHPLMHVRSLKALAGAQWATTSVDYNAEEDLRNLFEQHGLEAPTVMLKARSALSLMVGVAHSDLVALVPVQWDEFPSTRDALVRVKVRERLPAPPIVLVRRPDLPLTPAAEYFCDVMLRFSPLAVAPVATSPLAVAPPRRHPT